jgi:hypothetical protein
MTREEAIAKYNGKYPNYGWWAGRGRMFGYGTHMETLGGRLLSNIMERCYCYRKLEGMDTGFYALSDYLKSEALRGAAIVAAIPALPEMAVETAVRKLTGKTEF